MSNGRVSFRLPRIYEHAQGKVRTEFGKGYWWEKVLGIQGWESDYESVRRTLQYLKERKIASEGSRRSYGTYFGRFCSEYGITNPDELNQKDPAGISKLIENFLADNVNWSAHYKNTIRAYLLLHFKRNGFTNNRSLLVEYERVQRRSRINPEYIPSRGEIWAMADGVGDTYNMALILFLYYTGLRASTFCALQYGDIKDEYESKRNPLLIPIFPRMKLRVSGACKNNLPYYTFIKAEGLNALRSHLDFLKEYLGPLFTDKTFLFPPMSPRTAIKRTATNPLCTQTVYYNVKYAAKISGIERWKDVYPHCLRKAYEKILR